MEKALQFIAHVVVNIVDHPEDVRIRTLDRENEVIFEVHVHPEDQGAVIGRGGQTANALRTFLDVIGRREARRFVLEIADVDEGAGLDEGAEAAPEAPAATDETAAAAENEPAG